MQYTCWIPKHYVHVCTLEHWTPFSSHFVNLSHYKKALQSVDQKTLWKILRHYRVPEKLVSLTHNTYQYITWRVAHACKMSNSFEVKTKVWQGCLLSPFLFLLVIYWIIRTTASDRNNGIHWTLLMQLNDLDFVNDIALLSHTHSQMQSDAKQNKLP